MSAQLPGLVNGAVQDIRGQLAETIKRTEGIGGQLDIATTQLQQTAGRVDSLYSKGSFTGIKDTAVNTGLVDMLRTMRGSVEAIAPDNQRDAVAARMASVDDGLARLDAAAASGGSALADSPETLTSVVDGVVAGLQLAGAPAATIKTLQTQSKALRAALTRP
jgi:hypothetical protein